MNQAVHPFCRLIAAFENQDAGDRIDAVFDRQVLVVIRVQFSDLDLSGELIGDSVDRRRQGSTGAAPGRPKIDQHRGVAFHHFLFPIGGSKLVYICVSHDFNLSVVCPTVDGLTDSGVIVIKPKPIARRQKRSLPLWYWMQCGVRRFGKQFLPMLKVSGGNELDAFSCVF